MAAPIVYTDVAEGANVAGQLFAGKKFWVGQRVPSRTRYVEEIKSNGGEVVQLERQADYLIADHVRRDCPPGSISYTFIEKSIEKGAIQDTEDHLAGPPKGTAREVGSISRPMKGGRKAYTAEEDRILYKWVRDHEKLGGSASGNEIYKQLEVQHPRHTWQSWRDRYIKQLRDRPPAGLNVPDNAPPSPPSDQSTERLPPARSVVKKETAGERVQRPAQSQPVTESEQGRATTAPGLPPSVDAYTEEDFAKIFTTEDWEELYANVDHINGIPVAHYIEGWQSWAKGTEQTPEQWRQYFEKVVVPQWRADSSPRKKKIGLKVAKRHGKKEDDKTREESPAVTGPSTPTPKRRRKQSPTPVASPVSEDALVEKFLKERRDRDPQEAYIFWAKEKRLSMHNDHGSGAYDYKAIHAKLRPEWLALTEEEKAPYFVMEAADKRRYEIKKAQLSSAVKEEVSSAVRSSTATMVQETPDYVRATHVKIMKRIFDDEELEEELEEERLTKKQKHEHSAEEDKEAEDEIIGTQEQPIELGSTQSSSDDSMAEQDSSTQAQARPPTEDVDSVIPADDVNSVLGAGEDDVNSALGLDEDDSNPEINHSVEAAEDVQYPNLAHHTPPPADLEPPSSSDFPSNTPTPRAPRHQRPNAFDTQAILSPSQSQGFALAPLPKPSAHPASDPANLDSEASTTHSIEEFRRSLREEDDEQDMAFAPLPKPPRIASPLHAGSDLDADMDMDRDSQDEDEGDPDPPLSPSEIDLFIAEQQAEGFTNEHIFAALKHTRLRPDLAITVLEGWRDGGLGLPDMRGVWSEAEDRTLEEGDGIAIARLIGKHTDRGWGGFEERQRFLERLREGEGGQ